MKVPLKTFEEIKEEVEFVLSEHSVDLTGMFVFPSVEEMSPKEAADWMVSVMENVFSGDTYVNELLNELFCRTKMPYNPEGDIPEEWATELDALVKANPTLASLCNDGLMPE
jgi:hypothetical protein